MKFLIKDWALFSLKYSDYVHVYDRDGQLKMSNFVFVWKFIKIAWDWSVIRIN